MTFDEEWARLQAAAQDELNATRLNSDGGAGDGADYAVSGEELRPVHEVAGELADELDRNGSLARNPTHVAGIFLRTPGLETGYALIEVAERWQSQADALRSACRRIAGHVDATVRAHSATEQETLADLRGASAPASNPRLDALDGGPSWHEAR
ncbi:hypothetical protein [Streptomyces radicis]|uniref:Uncharacterized protein n=1 Tax=Streptomyces radicis TaxID=1750517 RepID=A0A3A9VVP0_9ACTN|nr:hypothetical protein [Streptomyces radicis]RKN05075.1 hypothetical protein D7319_26270 [Streptomyces radicis]RKN16401.1 hypothetical protein D7318_25635 [Streptomyces radicis]